ncbi:hypothetical protein [Ureibacillus thermosphaericus]|uniref:DUF8042 domain-containing protein n=1 Tax=Ureibacillus thermosphaericus TaxID=51173 RepID=A0A840Q3Y0_URETH|nr:hypothetical protein [Ureibacillus thermosphaericus]MBB5149726.1 hypothetical protein [Ureibacillus thermosphaericus]NKZ32640.1 hypothetical protein [Ureibacillus thermosphaericus]
MCDVLEVVESYNEYLKKIPNGTLYIAECLREEKLEEAFKTIKDFSEGVMWLIKVSELLRERNVEVTLNVEQINSFLIEINDAIENQDYLLVADLFEYEVAPFFKEVSLIANIS